jgi:hypothetical protein
MTRRQHYWAVYELRDGQWHPIPPAFEHVAEAEELRKELLKIEKYRGKELHVRQASYPVDPRKPPRKRRR